MKLWISKYARVALASLAAVFMLSQAAPAAGPEGKSFGDEPVETISVGVLKKLVDSKAKVLIIDTRVRGDYKMSDVQIRGAKSIPLVEIEKNLPDWPLGGEIVTYCS